jgi:hypothetical protein
LRFLRSCGILPGRILGFPRGAGWVVPLLGGVLASWPERCRRWSGPPRLRVIRSSREGRPEHRQRMRARPGAGFEAAVGGEVQIARMEAGAFAHGMLCAQSLRKRPRRTLRRLGEEELPVRTRTDRQPRRPQHRGAPITRPARPPLELFAFGLWGPLNRTEMKLPPDCV